MSHRVRSSDPSVSPPVTGSVLPSGQPDPNTLVEGARDAFIPAEAGGDVGKIATSPLASRAWGDRMDPILKRHMTEVLIRALGLTMAQIDEPNAGEGSQPPSGSRIS